jgi:hypothetical protein
MPVWLRAALLICAVGTASCRADERPRAPSVEQNVTRAPLSRDSAIAIAQRELLRATDAAEYMPDSIMDVLATDSSYQVMFKRLDWQRRRPGFGLVEVRRLDGRAVKIPLR